jgi:signal transduction histidine kinase
MAAALMREGAKDFIRKDNMARLIPAIEREVQDALERRARRQAEAERARSEQREQEAIAQVKAAQELDRLKNVFVNSISHELRTPLTAMLGFLEFLEDGVGGPTTPTQREYVRGLYSNFRRLQRLVDDLLDYARFEAGSFTLQTREADFVTVVNEVVESLRPQAEAARVAVEVSLPDGPAMVLMDPQRIEQVIANLMTNAIKFTPEGGRVRLRVCVDAARLRFEIADTGPGIPPDELPRLFHLFSQLAPGVRKGGTGLGLAISKSLVEAHGGTIGVDSEPGRGSTFWFELPMAMAVIEPAPAAREGADLARE